MRILATTLWHNPNKNYKNNINVPNNINFGSVERTTYSRSSRFRFSIPKALRDLFEIKEGDTVFLGVDNGRIIISKTKKENYVPRLVSTNGVITNAETVRKSGFNEGDAVNFDVNSQDETITISKKNK